MNLKINYKHLAAEFVIVVVGVAVALAADNWREGFQEQNLEEEYLIRLTEDLTRGYDDLTYQQGEAISAYEAASTFIDKLESGSDAPSSELIDLLILTTRMAPTPDQLMHDTTYREMLSAGQINIIRNTEIRSQLTRYYRQIDNLSFIRQNLPRTLFYEFNRLTGTNPWGLDSWQDIPVTRRNSLQNELIQKPEFVGELLHYKAQLGALIGDRRNRRSRYSNLIGINIELRELLI